MNEPMVKNAADPKQVRHAGRKERDARGRELDDLRVVLSTVEGRRLMWRLLSWSGYLQNPTHQRGDMTHQNIGRADCGRFLLSEIVELDEKIYLQMMQEARAFARSEQVEAEAARTASATQKPADS